MANPKRILCYGDSNTWGYKPVAAVRYDENTRWPCRLQKTLGEEYRVVEAGLSGRTTVFEDPFDSFRNGAASLGYTLLEADPIDLVILSLGTNDLKFATAAASARGIASLISQIREITTRIPSDRVISAAVEKYTPKAPKILVVSPILVHPEIEHINPRTTFVGGHEKSLGFAPAFRQIAEASGAYFLDAAKVAAPSDADGVHMTEEGHAALAAAVAAAVREIFKS